MKKTPMKWTWIFMILFLSLGILDFRFGILGLICMIAPLYHVFKGEGKAHCRKYCPRGSLLQKVLEGISLNQNMPKFMTTKYFKNVLLALMLTIFSVSMYHAAPNYVKISFAIFRFMSLSLIIGMIMGIVFKPRSWCVVCPMGHGAGIIDQELKKKNALRRLI